MQSSIVTAISILIPVILIVMVALLLIMNIRQKTKIKRLRMSLESLDYRRDE